MAWKYLLKSAGLRSSDFTGSVHSLSTRQFFLCALLKLQKNICRSSLCCSSTAKISVYFCILKQFSEYVQIVENLDFSAFYGNICASMQCSGLFMLPFSPPRILQSYSKSTSP